MAGKERTLFCERGPWAYQISLAKVRTLRCMKNCLHDRRIARTKSAASLPVLVYRHNSLIRRQLGRVDVRLQNNKATNLQLTAPKVNGILLRPGETFSFWALVGHCTAKKGYLPGLTLSKGKTGEGIAGGICQFTNLLHWLALHSPLTITEHHHHDGYDLFPDYGRQVPFGCGTSIQYNNLDYRLQNNTGNTFQLLTWVTDTHLCGELRAAQALPCSYHVAETMCRFVRRPDGLYRENTVERRTVDKRTGAAAETTVLRRSHAKVMYDKAFVPEELIENP